MMYFNTCDKGNKCKNKGNIRCVSCFRNTQLKDNYEIGDYKIEDDFMIEHYFNKAMEKLSKLTDDEFDELLIESGIENCPLEE